MMWKTIDSLPSTLDSMYRTSWLRIKSQSPEDYSIARRTFLWILYRQAEYELTKDLLCEALATSITSETYTEDAMPPLSLVEAVCGGLIRIVEGDETEIRLVRECLRVPA